MSNNGHPIVEQLHREAVRQMQNQPLPITDAPTLLYTDLPEGKAGQPLAVEWNTYRQEAGRLLAEGNEGRWVLIKEERIIGIWNTQEEALAEGYRRFLRQPFLVHQIQERERLLRTGYDRLCS